MKNSSVRVLVMRVLRIYFHPTRTIGYLLKYLRRNIEMNRGVHLAIALIIFFLYSYFLTTINKSDNIPLLFGFIAISIGSIIPDILEPPTSRMHRGVCHSKRALKFTLVSFTIIAVIGIYPTILPNYLSQPYIASNFFLGYTFHLFADSLTRAGLPN
jgi:hypothetical protein